MLLTILLLSSLPDPGECAKQCSEGFENLVEKLESRLRDVEKSGEGKGKDGGNGSGRGFKEKKELKAKIKEMERRLEDLEVQNEEEEDNKEREEGGWSWTHQNPNCRQTAKRAGGIFEKRKWIQPLQSQSPTSPKLATA